MRNLLLLLFTIPLLHMTQAQEILPLYKDNIPNSRPVKNEERSDPTKDSAHTNVSLVTRPTLTVFLPPKALANGAAVVICPGGGYTHLAIAHEGFEVARKFNGWGIAAFVLKYRLPSDQSMIDKKIGPLQDAQRAIQMVRENAAAWGIDPSRVGILGFSAGGHLASTAGTHFTKAVIDNPHNTSLRPDFMILIYPVITFADSISHHGSRDNLIGPSLTPENVWEYSNELQVTNQTPPTFLVHAGDDQTVPVINSLHFYEALLQHNIPAELHIYAQGGHGFGLHNPTTKDQWADRLQNWLDSNGWLTRH